MAKIRSKERVVEYSTEFKSKVVNLTNQLNIDVVEIAKALELHPVMIYRWRQEWRDGRWIEQRSRRISMTKRVGCKPETEEKELRRLRKEVKELEKENAFLKKWEEYLKAQKQKDSSS